MVKIPTYERQVSVPATTGMAAAPMALAETGAPQGLAKAAIELGEAAVRIQKREDVISRVRDFGNYERDVSTEWQRVQDQEDLTKPETLQKFNAFMQQKASEYHTANPGSADSKAVLEAQMFATRSGYERAAVGAMRDGQINMLKKQYGSGINPILSGVTDGSVTPEEAFQKVARLSDEIGQALPTRMAFDMHDAAQSAIAQAAIDRHLSVGDWKSAQAELDRHPEFANVMDVGTMQRVVGRIQQQRTAVDLASAQSMAKMDMQAKGLGFDNWSQVPKSWKISIMTGQPIPGTQPYEPKTDAAKAVYDRTNIARLYGADSDQVKAFDRLTTGATVDMSSPTGKLFQDKQRLQMQGKGPGDPDFDAIDQQIKAANPEYVKKKELADKFPAAQVAFDSFKRQAASVQDNASKALMLMTGTENINDAKKAVEDGDLAYAMTGLTQKAMLLKPGSNVSEVDGMLNQLRGSAMFDAMQNLRNASPTGGTGMGQISDKEGAVLQALKGSLSLASPLATARTLIDIINDTPEVISGRETAFNADFGLSQPKKDKKKEGSAQAAPAPLGGPVRYDLNGNPIKVQ